MALEYLLNLQQSNALRFIRNKGRTLAVALTLGSGLLVPNKSEAIMDSDGSVSFGGGMMSCEYKGHRLLLNSKYVNGKVIWYTYKAYNHQGKEIDFQSLHPTKRLLYDPNIGICEDIEEEPDPRFRCC